MSGRFLAPSLLLLLVFIGSDGITYALLLTELFDFFLTRFGSAYGCWI